MAQYFLQARVEVFAKVDALQACMDDVLRRLRSPAESYDWFTVFSERCVPNSAVAPRAGDRNRRGRPRCKVGSEARQDFRTLAEAVKRMRDEQDAFQAWRRQLQQAYTIMESMQAVKTFEFVDLGLDHKRGGNRL